MQCEHRPVDAVALDFFAGMDPLNVLEFGWALEGESRLVAELRGQLAEMRQRMAEDASRFLDEKWQLDETDRAVLADPAIADQNLAVTAEVVRGDGWGWVDDSLAFVDQWGFDVAEVSVPLRITYGLRDVLVPPSHGAWLASQIPAADVIIDDGAGHLMSSSGVAESIRWLVTGE